MGLTKHFKCVNLISFIGPFFTPDLSIFLVGFSRFYILKKLSPVYTPMLVAFIVLTLPFNDNNRNIYKKKIFKKQQQKGFVGFTACDNYLHQVSLVSH